MITIHFDGACEYNPANGKRNPGGIATYGWLIQENGQTLAYGLGEIVRGEGATNNRAEYEALIRGLQAAKDMKLTPDEIRGDSQLVVYQVSGFWRVNSPHLQELCTQARSLLGKLKIAWVPREQNEEADKLSKQAYNLSKTSAEKKPWHERRRITVTKERQR